MLAGHDASVVCVKQWTDDLIATGSKDNIIRVWKKKTLMNSMDLEQDDGTGDWFPFSDQLAGHTDTVLCLETSKSFLFSGSHDKTIRVWNLEEDCVAVLQANAKVCSLKLLEWDNMMAVGCLDGKMQVWTAEESPKPDEQSVIVNWKNESSLDAHKDAVSGLESLKDRCLLASVSWDTTIKLWKMKTGTHYCMPDIDLC
jgi:WD40 repeat protein